MNRKASYTIRIVAGAYLIYLAYSLVKGYFVEGDMSVGFVLAGILFGAIGLFFCVTGFLGQREVNREMQEEQAAEEEALFLSQEEKEDVPKEAEDGRPEGGSGSEKPKDSRPEDAK